MTNPLHHTIRNRTSAKLLLCRQWIERINFERIELYEASEIEYNVWIERIRDDIHLAIERLKEDGYTRQHAVYINHVTCLSGECEYAFVPIVFTLSPKIEHVEMAQIWSRKAAQS